MIDPFCELWHAPDGWPIRRARLSLRAGARGSLLFLSGRGDHMEKYAEALHGWAEQGWLVESFDWRGQGGSGRFAKDPLLGHVEDFGCWLDDLQAYDADWQRRHSGPHIVVAHSMGAHIALRALAENRISADAAVLIAPMLGIHAGGLPQLLTAGIARLVCAFGHSGRSLWPPRHRRTPRMVEALRRALTHSRERFDEEVRLRQERPELALDAPSWGWMRAAFHSIAILEKPGYLEQVTKPTLILATRGDRLVSAPAIARLARRLPHARLHFYGRDVAHEILREVDAVRNDALARIDAFLDEYAPGEAETEARA